MKNWCVPATLFTLLFIGCTKQDMTNTQSTNATARDICSLVRDYTTTNVPVDPELKRELAQVNIDNFVTDAEGKTFSFRGGWRFDPGQNKLTSEGYWIGDEHAWYEISFQVGSGKLSIADIQKRRERVKR